MLYKTGTPKQLTQVQIHLFDIDVPGKIKFTESDTLSAGNSLTMFDAGWLRSFFFLKKREIVSWLVLLLHRFLTSQEMSKLAL